MSWEAISLKKQSNNSHFHRKDLVSIEEEENMEAYILCKNINNFLP